MNSTQKGTYAELVVAMKAAEKGYFVGMMPQGCPYDMVVDTGSGPLRVQVKYSQAKNDICKVKLNPTGQLRNNTIYSKDNVDIIALFEVNTNQIAWIKIEDFNEVDTASLRLTKPKNNQLKGVTMFTDFLDW